MKIHFDNTNIDAATGPNVFASRLARALFESGHEVCFNDGPSADVSLVFIERSGQPLAKKVVHRLDGLWFKPLEFHTHNVNIKKTYDLADAIIWQSEFDRSFVTKWWGPKRGATIGNGIALSPCKQLTIPALVDLRNNHKMMFVCSSNWHPQKRLRSNIRLFNYIKTCIEPHSCLIVLGSNPDFMVADKNIFYAGSQPHEVCDEIYAASNWMLHLAYLDHCPNVVCEALAQGTPVICPSDGGTKELVGDFGLVLNETKPYDWQLTDYDNPPDIDVTQLETLPPKSALGSHANIDINYVVTQYVKLFSDIV